MMVGFQIFHFDPIRFDVQSKNRNSIRSMYPLGDAVCTASPSGYAVAYITQHVCQGERSQPPHCHCVASNYVVIYIIIIGSGVFRGGRWCDPPPLLWLPKFLDTFWQVFLSLISRLKRPCPEHAGVCVFCLCLFTKSRGRGLSLVSRESMPTQTVIVKRYSSESRSHRCYLTAK